MKRLLLIAAVALMCALAGAPRASAQMVNFSYTGVPASVTPGSSFTFDLTLNFTSGGGFNNVMGFSMWLYQVSPGTPPYNFALTSRDVTGSLFSIVGPVTFPSPLDPVTHSDLGQLAVNPLPSGSYFLAHYTMSIGAGALPGSYTIGNSTSATPMVGGRISVINDSNGNTIPIAASNFTIQIVPEPSTFALLATTAIGLCAVMLYRRRVARYSHDTSAAGFAESAAGVERLGKECSRS